MNPERSAATPHSLSFVCVWKKLLLVHGWLSYACMYMHDVYTPTVWSVLLEVYITRVCYKILCKLQVGEFIVFGVVSLKIDVDRPGDDSTRCLNACALCWCSRGDHPMMRLAQALLMPPINTSDHEPRRTIPTDVLL